MTVTEVLTNAYYLLKKFKYCPRQLYKYEKGEITTYSGLGALYAGSKDASKEVVNHAYDLLSLGAGKRSGIYDMIDYEHEEVSKEDILTLFEDVIAKSKL